MSNVPSSGMSRSGLDSRASSPTADDLFLKVFSGEILTSYAENTIMRGLHTVRTISSGKSAQFPVSGIATADYHSAGNSIIDNNLSKIAMTEKVINIDDVLLASTFLPNVDELKQHYDVRSIYATELGKALAKRFDIATMKTLYAAALSASNLSAANGGKGGTQILSTTLDTAQGIVDALYGVAEALDKNDAPDSGRYAILSPREYYNLITADNNAVSIAINRDAGGTGSIATGSIAQVAGITIYKSNHLADIADGLDDSSVVTGDGSSAVKNDPFGSNGAGYNGNFQKLRSGAGTAGDPYKYGILAGCKEAIGTVKLLDLATESEYQIERQGHLFVAKYMMGHGVLRPECAVAVEVEASATDA